MIRKCSYRVSSASFVGRAVWVNATARTMREGGVKSPGRPIIPLPDPRGEKFRPPSSPVGNATGERLT